MIFPGLALLRLAIKTNFIEDSIVEMALWEKVLLGIGVLLIILWFRPGIKAVWKRSQEAENKDWGGLLLPIGMVVVFVLLLILMVRN